jgi:valyl-tRNA synthetase
VFVTLYREGLIYKDKRLVNWDPKLKTAISDLEVQQIETKGQLWFIKYPIEDTGEFIVVATTRPETMLGDVAVAVHPDNEQLKHLIGKTAILPLVGRRIPVVADDYADPEKGSGAVKITPAHDFNDFEVGRRHNLPLINVFDEEAHLTLKNNEAFLKDTHPELVLLDALEGKSREAARKQIGDQLESRGLIEKIEPTTHVVPHGDRSGAVLEPFLTDQWYVDAKTLAEPAIEAVRERKTVFVPSQWEATYFNWMENIQPWCISRQIWWGHQIPAWYGPDGKIFVAENEDDAVADALAHYTDIEEIKVEEGHDIAADPARRERFAREYLHRDEDVLDTWFSSALWPFSTLGWPDETPELKRFYPTSTLVTGFDIIFFWVARMMMMGLHFMGEVPFRRVFINALIRDEEGVKMSKAKGNVLDPLEIVDAYGADALRFTLAAMSGQARDIKLSLQRIEGYRNFGTKLWNAARFCQMNGAVVVAGFDPALAKNVVNRWIIGELAKSTARITAALEACAFDEAGGELYRFIWNVFCDWYVELAKPVLAGAEEEAKVETRAIAGFALETSLKLLHPVMPFLTEELRAQTAPEAGPREHQLIGAAWPTLDPGLVDPEAEAEIGWVVELVTQVRQLRAEMNLAQSARPRLELIAPDPRAREFARRHGDLVVSLARLGGLGEADAPAHGSAVLLAGDTTAALAVASHLDLAVEKTRLSREIDAKASDIDRARRKLANADFIAKAPSEVVEESRERLEEALVAKGRLEAARARLESLA